MEVKMELLMQVITIQHSHDKVFVFEN